MTVAYPWSPKPWPRAVRAVWKVHLGDKNLGAKYSNAIFSLVNGVVIARGESHAKEMDTVAGKDEDQHNKEDGDEEDLLEASA